MKEKKPNKPHNFLFADVYSQKKHSMDLLKLTFSQHELRHFNWKTLRVKKGPFFDENWNGKRADLIFSVKEKNSSHKTEIFFLLEHKSYQTKDIFRQLLEYQTFIYRTNRTPVVPIVIYHGRASNWKLPRNFHDYLNFGSSDVKKILKKDVLNFGYRLLNIRKLDIEKIKRSLTSTPILFIMQNIWKLDEDKLKKLFLLGNEMALAKRIDMIGRAIKYIMNYDKSITWEILLKAEKETLPKQGESIVSVLKRSFHEEREEGIEVGMERGRKEGREEGIEVGVEKGRTAVALKLLQEGMEISFVARVSGLSVKKIKSLKN